MITQLKIGSRVRLRDTVLNGKLVEIKNELGQSIDAVPIPYPSCEFICRVQWENGFEGRVKHFDLVREIQPTELALELARTLEYNIILEEKIKRLQS
jgi:hypothetical protein